MLDLIVSLPSCNGKFSDDALGADVYAKVAHNALARVLVADDSAIVHMVMGRLLTQLGYIKNVYRAEVSLLMGLLFSQI